VELRNRKDGVEEVKESGLVIVNKHIFWRSATGNTLKGQGYEFMTAYDTKHGCPPDVTFAWSSWWWWNGMGSPTISQYGTVKLSPG